MAWYEDPSTFIVVVVSTVVLCFFAVSVIKWLTRW